jgi:hypothetical protein
LDAAADRSVRFEAVDVDILKGAEVREGPDRPADGTYLKFMKYRLESWFFTCNNRFS